MPICEICGLEYCTAGGLKKHIGCPGAKAGDGRPETGDREETGSKEQRAEGKEQGAGKKIGKRSEVESIGKTTADMGEKEFKKDGIEGKK